jgi:hypothetical protein
VTVDMPPAIDPEVLRAERDQAHEGLRSVFERQREAPFPSFEDAYNNERASFGRMTLEVYRDWVERRIRIAMHEETVSLNDAFPPGSVGIFSALVGQLEHEHGMTEEAACKKVIAFLASKAPFEAPTVKISSALWAVLAMSAARGQRTPPTSGLRRHAHRQRVRRDPSEHPDSLPSPLRHQSVQLKLAR